MNRDTRLLIEAFRFRCEATPKGDERDLMFRVLHTFEDTTIEHDRCAMRRPIALPGDTAKPLDPIPDIPLHCGPACGEMLPRSTPPACLAHATARRDALVFMVARMEKKIRDFRAMEGPLSQWIFDATVGTKHLPPAHDLDKPQSSGPVVESKAATLAKAMQLAMAAAAKEAGVKL